MLKIDKESYYSNNKAFELYSNNGIKVIDWFPYSLDLNPIENIWTFIKNN